MTVFPPFSSYKYHLQKSQKVCQNPQRTVYSFIYNSMHSDFERYLTGRIFLPSKTENSAIIIDSYTIKAKQGETDSYETQLAKTYCQRLRFDGSLIHGIMLSSPAVVFTQQGRIPFCQRHSYQLKRLDSNTPLVPFF